MKKSFSLSLFWKFTIAIAMTVALFGSINLYFLNFAVYNLFEKELTRHGLTTGQFLAERSVSLLLYDDLATLNYIVSESKRIDSSVAYIFILDKNRNVLAHTFKQAVPVQLISANFPDHDLSSTAIIKDKQSSEGTIRDLAIPILEGNLGSVRIGFYEESYFSSIKETTRIFLFMVLLFLSFGILGAFIFSYIITAPIKIISATAEKLDLSTLPVLNFQHVDSKGNKIGRLKNLLNVRDEIDTLISKFEEMVTRLRHTYKELQATQISLFQSEKMASIGTLSAGIAHEINNPIAGIQSCVRRISEAPGNIKQNEQYLEMMGEAVDKIEKVVTGLLNYSRKRDLVFDRIDPTNIIENALILVAFQIEKSRISVIKKYSVNMPLVRASANHLEQVALNLLLNSIDAINERMQNEPGLTGEITLKIRKADSFVELEISDNGVGVPDDQLNHIFDPFFTLKKVRQGTGLGLSVCFNIVEQHGGKINALVKKSGGMRFVVSVPAG
jgi:two-component system NtrC family sensor kinase